jgi:hypothetical protein
MATKEIDAKTMQQNDMKSETALIFLTNKGWVLVSGKLIPPVKSAPLSPRRGAFCFLLSFT